MTKQNSHFHAVLGFSLYVDATVRNSHLLLRMSVTVASPASLEPWSASQRKAASRIFAQALFSALPKAPSSKGL